MPLKSPSNGRDPDGFLLEQILSKFPRVNSAVLFQMSCHKCISCKDPLLDTDGHSESLLVWAAPTQRMRSMKTCSHCESMSLACFHSQIAFFHEGGPPGPALPLLFSPEQWVSSIHRPCALLSPRCLSFRCATQRRNKAPSSAASSLVSFGASEEEVAVKDSMSLAASDAEEWVCSGEKPEAPSLSQSVQPES